MGELASDVRRHGGPLATRVPYCMVRAVAARSLGYSAILALGARAPYSACPGRVERRAFFRDRMQ